MGDNVYKSDLTPKPGPLGGSVSEVSPPAGSHENRPLLATRKAKKNFYFWTEKQGTQTMPVGSFLYLGPGGGTLPAFSSSIISSMSFGVRSSWKQE